MRRFKMLREIIVKLLIAKDEELHSCSSISNSIIIIFPNHSLQETDWLRSSLLDVFYKIVVLKNVLNYTGKHIQPSTLVKKGVHLNCFLVNFENFFRTVIL